MLLNFEELYANHKMNIKGVIHVGGHHGQEHELYTKLRIKNVIYFEPLKKNFEILKSNVPDNSILFNTALGNFEGKVIMNVESNNDGQSSSIMEPHIHLEHYPYIVFDDKEEVEIKMLNNIPIDFNGYNFLNIDVQCYELEVLKGSDRILKFIDYILIEVNKVEMYKNCPLVSGIDNFLYNYGFVRKDSLWVDDSWGDALYIKKTKK